jgi:hypothetical protein
VCEGESSLRLLGGGREERGAEKGNLGSNVMGEDNAGC